MDADKVSPGIIVDPWKLGGVVVCVIFFISAVIVLIVHGRR